MAGPNAKKVAEKIRELKGNVSAVAAAFGRNRTAMSNYIHNRPKLKQLLTEAREAMVDGVESRFYDDCLKDDPSYQTSRIFFLKTQGKSRGYVEKSEVEHSGPGGGPMMTEVVIEHHTAAGGPATSEDGGGPVEAGVPPGPDASVEE